MSSGKDFHEGKVAAALNFTCLLAIRFQVLHFSLVEGFLSGPLEGFGPGMISLTFKSVCNVLMIY